MSNLFFPEDNLFDSHCHLNEHSFNVDRDEVVWRAVDAGVGKVIDIAIDINCTQRAIGHAKKYPGVVYASAGIDPDVILPTSELYQGNLDADEKYWDEQMAIVRDLAANNRKEVICIGETGIDGYWVNRITDEKMKNQEFIDKVNKVQEMLFRKHLEIAVELKYPLSIHSRAAEQKCLEVVRNYPAARGVFHSYTGSYEIAKQILDSGWALGLNGIITFKNAHELRETYKKILGKVSSDWQPTDFYSRGVYFETDAPYLAPEGKRGERNEPAFVANIFDIALGALKN